MIYEIFRNSWNCVRETRSPTWSLLNKNMLRPYCIYWTKKVCPATWSAFLKRSLLLWHCHVEFFVVSQSLILPTQDSFTEYPLDAACGTRIWAPNHFKLTMEVLPRTVLLNSRMRGFPWSSWSNLFHASCKFCLSVSVSMFLGFPTTCLCGRLRLDQWDEESHVYAAQNILRDVCR